jgi:hypothetical protein
MKCSYILPIFLVVAWTVVLVLESISSETIDMNGKARINPAVRDAIVTIQMNTVYKYERARTLAAEPAALLTQADRFVLSERFDYDKARFKAIRAYYQKLSALRDGDMPPFLDKTVTVSPLRR